MASQINPNNIDGNYPVAGQDNNSQGFRDNFTNAKTNFQYAEDEINDLQSKGVFKSALIGQPLDNNMNDNLIYAAKIRDFSATRVAIPDTTGTITVDYAAGHYQTIATAGNISLVFTNFPPAASYGAMRIQFNVTNIAHTLTLPSAVSLGISGVQGISPGLSGSSNTITFGATGFYEFGFSSADGGTTITLFDLNRALTNFVSADIQTDDLTATGSVTAAVNLVGGNVLTSGFVSATGNVVSGNLVVGGTASVTGSITGGNVITTGFLSTTGNVQALNVNGIIYPTVGTPTIPPVKMTPGSLLNTPSSGVIELDSNVFYATPTAGASSSQRGVLSSTHMIVTPSAGRTLTQNTSAQAVFNNPTNGALTLTASTTYEIEGLYYINNTAAPSASHSLSTLFAVSGTLFSISYTADVTTSSGAPSSGTANVSRTLGTAVTAVQVTPAVTTSSEIIIVHIRGIVRTNSSGTFTPQIRYNTNAPGGTSTILVNSFFRVSAIGNSSFVSVGNWA
jgi:hypothetical protein